MTTSPPRSHHSPRCRAGGGCSPSSAASGFPSLSMPLPPGTGARVGVGSGGRRGGPHSNAVVACSAFRVHRGSPASMIPTISAILPREVPTARVFAWRGVDPRSVPPGRSAAMKAVASVHRRMGPASSSPVCRSRGTPALTNPGVCRSAGVWRKTQETSRGERRWHTSDEQDLWPGDTVGTQRAVGLRIGDSDVARMERNRRHRRGGDRPHPVRAHARHDGLEPSMDFPWQQ